MLTNLLRNAVTRILERHHQVLARVGVAGPHLTRGRVLSSIHQNLLYHNAHVLLVDVYHQPLVGIVGNILHPRLLIVEPRRLAAGVEDGSKVDRTLLDLNHPGIQTRQEQDVVDELQQQRGIVVDLLDEKALVLRRVLQLKQFGKAYHRVERRADLVAHVAQEGVLHRLHLLGLGSLPGQILLRSLQLADVAAHADISRHTALLVQHRRERQVEHHRVVGLSLAAMMPQHRLHRCRHGRLAAVVHAVESPQGYRFRLVVTERHGPRLRQLKLRLAQLAVHNEHVGVKIIFDDTHATVLQHEVDVAHIPVELRIGFLQQNDIPLQPLVELGYLRHVAAGDIDRRQLAIVVTHRQYLHLIAHILGVQIPRQRPSLVRLAIQLGQ